jgi:hypothetical protein
MRRRQRQQPLLFAEWPPALRYVVHASREECPRGHADALAELTTLALRKVPSRGIFDPAVRGEDDLFTAIDAVAERHLQLGDARTEWRRALEAAELSFDRRDDVEQAALRVRSVSDTAYFYAGLAFGLAFLAISDC